MHRSDARTSTLSIGLPETDLDSMSHLAPR